MRKTLRKCSKRYFMSSTSELTKKCVRTDLAVGPCPLSCPDGLADGTSSKSRPSRVSGRALQKLHVCDSSCACQDKPLLKLLNDDFQLIFSGFHLFHTIPLIFSQGFSLKP
jgi:hypothetical protein